ncbi:MAG: DUF1501 domain-containing protein [Planctomycetia bacterium]|nr:DUF1501 domain-containing protein [Planctomycetia bacterium]
MLSVGTTSSSDRRTFLRAGGLGVAGLGGLSLSGLLRRQAEAKSSARSKSLIYIVLSGGPSHIDMYDMKPGAPAEFRGPFSPVATSLPGCEICEFMPLQAKLMNRIALVRGIRSVENDHFLSEVYTGLPRTAGARPSFGSLISRLLPNSGALPSYVNVNEKPGTNENDYEWPHYAGPEHAPFRPSHESLADLTPAKSLDRLRDRRELLTAFDALKRQVDQVQSYRALDRYQAKAFEIVTSAAVRDAFDLSKEPPKVVERYGKGGQYTHQTYKDLRYPWDAKPFILARRLVEAGVRIVTVAVGNWDHHSGANSDIFVSLRTVLPALDRSLYALFEDLRERGLEQDVGVVVLGEFGRTPKITYPGPGREHWAEAGCALFYGGSWKTGQVLGATDARAERSLDGRIGFQNVMASIYRLFGIDPTTAIADFNGRPQYLLDHNYPIAGLI